ncbi:putative albumin I chain a [Medicago truncatula]|uniref:Albumin I n=1 Tax=Medicago truncatula TaxID=3880 RepID=A0A072UZT8_MEDTR|nr:albumin-1 [Medicago truncatula]KEH34658.1 albumin I [Medicago truncatula]RHN68199.1 putative albumin I chain a [Medicago truncatula]
MTYVKLAPFAVFMLAAFLIFPMKKVEAAFCFRVPCNPDYGCNGDCVCALTWHPVVPMYECYDPRSYAELKKKVEEPPKLCWSHAECTKKGSGNYCARFPNLQYGLCFPSVSEAVNAFKMASSLKFEKDFLKMSLPA